MTDLVRTVRSGSVGLDLVLGGGLRLLHRIDGSPRESATLLVRGGPGTGKSVLAADLALRLARAIGGDVLYACIEILPREILAQRMGFDGFDTTKAIDLAQPDARKTSGEPTLVVGMTEMEMSPSEEGDVPDVGGMILDLRRISVERGCEPRVVVVDSLSDGYGLGAGAPRPTVDGVCKLAVQQGWVLILVEEAIDDRASPWAFAVDTVLSLEVTPEGRRELRVTKHRFGPCQPGPHRLLVEREGVRVIPCFAAYRNAVRDLALPPPATNRSLWVPGPGRTMDWALFGVSDGEGRVVIVPSSLPTSDSLDRLTAAIGATARDGSCGGKRVTLSLSESPHEDGRLGNAAVVHVSTLHPTIDGEDWLEAALSHLVAVASPLAQVRIGPTERLGLYDSTLQMAIGMLAAILARRGLIVVVYGTGFLGWAIRGAIVWETWAVQEETPVGSLKVQRIVGDDTLPFEAAVP